MADDDLDGLEETGSSVPSKKGGFGGVVTKILKWVAIGLGAVILIVVIVVITMRVAGGNTSAQQGIPISDEYVVQRELLDWYALNSIRTRTSDENPASVVVVIQLGYKKDDKATSAEITQRSVELRDFLRRYFTEKTAAELRPQNEQKLKIELRNAINDEILSSSKIKDIAFDQLDVIEQ